MVETMKEFFKDTVFVVTMSVFAYVVISFATKDENLGKASAVIISILIKRDNK